MVAVESVRLRRTSKLIHPRGVEIRVDVKSFFDTRPLPGDQVVDVPYAQFFSKVACQFHHPVLVETGHRCTDVGVEVGVLLLDLLQLRERARRLFKEARKTAQSVVLLADRVDRDVDGKINPGILHQHTQRLFYRLIRE